MFSSVLVQVEIHEISDPGRTSYLPL